MTNPVRIVIVNSLGAALAHYTASLGKMMTDCGTAVSTMTLNEPSASGQSRVAWVMQYVRLLRAVARQEGSSVVILTWPVFGYWDFVIARAIFGDRPVRVVLHDPNPLVRAKGYGRIARTIASLPIVASSAIVHSNAAADVVRKQSTLANMTQLPLPMLPPRRPEPGQSDKPIIRVLGQYKADRDIESMARIAAEGPRGWRYEVVGRRWPAVAGWQVSDRFVEEEEFETLIKGSDVILIPYTRFFQSDVAIRSLEMGTPVVGPRSSSLADVLGSSSNWLVDGESWTQAVEAAIRTDPQEIYRVASSLYNNVLKQWRAWLGFRETGEDSV